MKKLKLTHWVNNKYKDLVLQGKGLWEIPLEELKIRSIIKPFGCWISVNNSWEEWINSEDLDWFDNETCLKVILNKDINLFIIDSKEKFLEEYKKLIGKDYLYKSLTERWNMTNFHLKLREKYDGIWLKEETFLKHRFDIQYFYTWDCESICVWNKNKIKFKEIEDE